MKTSERRKKEVGPTKSGRRKTHYFINILKIVIVIKKTLVDNNNRFHQFHKNKILNTGWNSKPS